MRNLFDTASIDGLDGPDLLVAPPSDGTEGDDFIKGTSGTDYLYGYGGNDTLMGLGGYDQLVGGTGDDSLLGGSGDDLVADDDSGNDQLFGEGGDDNVELYRHADVTPPSTEHVLLDGGAGNDWLSINAAMSDGSDYDLRATMLGGDGDDTFYVYRAAHLTLDAGAGNDHIQVRVGQDIQLTLGAGADLVELNTPQGEDALVITDFETGDIGDRVQMRYMLHGVWPDWDETNPFGDGHMQLVQRGADAVVQIDTDGGGDSWRDFIVFQGTDKDDLTAFNLDGFPTDGTELTGESITGTDGVDSIDGTVGADTIDGAGGDDIVFGGAGADSIIGGEGNDAIYGEYGSDTLEGGDGADTIGASGHDLALGGDGDDDLYAFAVDGMTNTSTLEGGSGDDYLSIDFYYGGAAVALGGDGDDRFYLWKTGFATLDGGDGDDSFDISENTGAGALLTLGAGRDVVRISLDDSFPPPPSPTVRITDFTAGDGGDRLDFFDYLDARLVGWDHSTNPFAQGFLRLHARAGSTEVQIRTTGDGAWSDLFVLNGVSAGSLTAENLGGYPSDGSPPPGILIMGGGGADHLTGANGADTILGAKGDDSLDGASGDDSLSGGKGDDTLDGGYGVNILDGGAGDDILLSEHGWADTVLGGAGDDNVTWANSDPIPEGVVSIDGGSGDDYILFLSSNPTTQSVQVIGGDGRDTISVNYSNGATIEGGAGDDTISIGHASYTVDAGTGDDIVVLYGADADAHITLGAGADQVVLGPYYETVQLAEVTDFGSQDSLGLDEFGSDPFNTGYLRIGQQAHDTVLQIWTREGRWENLLKLDGVGAAGLTVGQLDGRDPGDLWLLGGDRHDKLVAGSGFTHLDGAGGSDALVGSSGADVLEGGEGADRLTGKGGADVFLYEAVTDSTATAHDLINGLSDADVIDVSGVDANANVGGDQAFVLVDAFDGHSNELMLSYDGATKTTTLAGDVDGDGAADFVVLIKGDHHDFSNFVL